MSQDRPCKRCIKRNIGHLCHDEPREGQHRKSKSEADQAGVDESTSPMHELSASTALTGGSILDDTGQEPIQDNNMGIRSMSNEAPSVPNLGSMTQSTGANGSGQARMLRQETLGKERLTESRIWI